MKRLSLALAVLAMTTGLALAQDNNTPQSGSSSDRSMSTDRNRTDLGAPRGDKAGTDQRYNTGATGSEVGRDRDTVTTTDIDNDRDMNADRKGTGVATGFVAAGIGLALLGLFVRRRNRRYGHYDDDDTTRGAPPRV
jgi:hypothetical protein